VQVDCEFEVFSDGKNWFVYCSASDEETGPFDGVQEALQEARRFAVEKGFLVLDTPPWDSEDFAAWPM